MAQIHFIVNAYSGGGKGQLILNQLKNDIASLNCVIHEPSSLHSIRHILLTINYTQLDKLIVIGGDGTLHHIVNILHQEHLNIPIGYIPAGTGNDFCRGLSLSDTPQGMLQRILNSTQPINIPILSTDQFIAINSIGLGFDALVCQNVEKSRIKSLLNRWHLGPLVYIIYLIKSLFQFKKFPCQLNDKKFHNVALCVLMNNAYFGGGIQFDSLLQHRDTLFSTIIIHDVTLFKIPSILWALIKKKHLEHPCFYRHTFTSATLQLQQRIPLQADGEITHTSYSPMHVTLLQQSFWL